MEMTGALREAFERTYRAFAGFASPRYLETSPHRDADEILRTLTSKPLRALTDEDLGPYSGWAMTTVGSADDYRHFLPRIFELASNDQTHLGFQAPIIASKLKYGGWTDWPVEQQAAVRDIFEAIFQWAIELHPNLDQSAPGWLCGSARLDLPVERLLAAWRGSSSPEAALQFAEFVMKEERLGLQPAESYPTSSGKKSILRCVEPSWPG
jgi:hypothetical protein